MEVGDERTLYRLILVAKDSAVEASNGEYKPGEIEHYIYNSAVGYYDRSAAESYMKEVRRLGNFSSRHFELKIEEIQIKRTK